MILPRDNSRLGPVEIGVVFLLYAVAGGIINYQECGVTAGVTAAAATAMLSSVIWYVAVLAMFYTFFGTPRQQIVFRAEGNYEDFARSGMIVFNSWIMENFFGAGFFHLLLGPLIAIILGIFGWLVGLSMRHLQPVKNRQV